MIFPITAHSHYQKKMNRPKKTGDDKLDNTNYLKRSAADKIPKELLKYGDVSKKIPIFVDSRTVIFRTPKPS